MSGIEPTALTGPVLNGIAKSAAEDPGDKSELRDLASKSGSLDPAARAYAKRLAVKEQIRLKIWQPLGMLFGVPSDYFANDFENELADKMTDIPDEYVVTPRLSLAGPTVQGIAFTVEEPELKEMYLNLLATASDGRSRERAHPSFAEIIRQLSAAEAQDLSLVLKNDAVPIIEVHCLAKDFPESDIPGYNQLATNILNWGQGGTEDPSHERSIYIDNWVRLGLITVSYDKNFTTEERYSWAEENAFVKNARREFDSPDFKRISIQKGVLARTDFGKLFAEVVMNPSAPSDEGNDEN